MQEIEALGAMVCGVSVDSSDRLAQFAAGNGLPFVLLSDRGGAVSRRYGSLIDLGLLKFARRNTFLIDPHGRIVKVYLKVDPAHNAKDVIAGIKELNRA
jgi:peroxiredoxin Q/BCP